MCVCEGLHSIHVGSLSLCGVSVEAECFLQVLPTARDSQGLGLRRPSGLLSELRIDFDHCCLVLGLE